MEDRAALDWELVQSALEGDGETYGEIVTRYQRLVAGVAWRYGVAASDIEDVVSEVFIKAYQKLHLYRPEHPFSTWLYRVSANHVVDRGRRAKKAPQRVEMPETVVDSRPSAQEQLADHERALLVREALEEVAQHYRDALFLVYVEGNKVEEAARILEIPLGTVKTRLMRGRKALRKILVRRHPATFGADDAV